MPSDIIILYVHLFCAGAVFIRKFWIKRSQQMKFEILHRYDSGANCFMAFHSICSTVIISHVLWNYTYLVTYIILVVYSQESNWWHTGTEMKNFINLITYLWCAVKDHPEAETKFICRPPLQCAAGKSHSKIEPLWFH